MQSADRTGCIRGRELVRRVKVRCDAASRPVRVTAAGKASLLDQPLEIRHAWTVRRRLNCPRHSVRPSPHGRPMQHDARRRHPPTPDHAPINWVTTILFTTATPLAAMTLVPVVRHHARLQPDGVADRARLPVGRRHLDHRRISPALGAPRLQRALVRAALLHAVRRDVAAEQHPDLGVAAPHPPSLRRRLGQGPLQRAARVLVLAHGLDPAELPERRERLHQRQGPRARPDGDVPAPVLPAAHAVHEHRLPAAARLGDRRGLGRVPARGPAAPGGEPSLHVVHQLAGPHVGLAAVHRREHRARQPVARVHHVR